MSRIACFGNSAHLVARPRGESLNRRGAAVVTPCGAAWLFHARWWNESSNEGRCRLICLFPRLHFGWRTPPVRRGATVLPVVPAPCGSLQPGVLPSRTSVPLHQSVALAGVRRRIHEDEYPAGRAGHGGGRAGRRGPIGYTGCAGSHRRGCRSRDGSGRCPHPQRTGVDCRYHAGQSDERRRALYPARRACRQRGGARGAHWLRRKHQARRHHGRLHDHAGFLAHQGGREPHRRRDHGHR